MGVPRACQFLLSCTYLPFGPLSQESRPVSARTSWQTWNGRWTQISTMRAAEQQRGLLPTPPQGQVGTQQERSRPPPKSPRKTMASLKAKEADEVKKHAEAEKTAKIVWEAKKKAELAKETARKAKAKETKRAEDAKKAKAKEAEKLAKQAEDACKPAIKEAEKVAAESERVARELRIAADTEAREARRLAQQGDIEDAAARAAEHAVADRLQVEEAHLRDINRPKRKA